ncbi:DEAD/DEAH box helicase [Coralliovum pocilloporae]|uniref:DEAD/DEAH box helicase n=1 Tax=Coralliovum pocilloporae TaxID=3066369 RepID=UPI0033076E18
MSHFDTLGLSSSLLKTVAGLGFDTPTPIQREAIPLVLEGHDIMGLAQTGTGKTAAFGLPLVHKLVEEHQRPEPKTARALILAPTRELVNQIGANLRSYVKRTPLRVEQIIGGASIAGQCRRMERGADILVATPGRLLDLVDRRAITLDKTTFLVLDEADQMLDLGFIHSLRKIAKLLARPRQTLLFSATMPKQMEDLSRSYLTDPVRIEVSPPGKAADKIRQSVHFVHARGKPDLLKRCLSERKDALSLVFARTKHGAEKLMKLLVASGFKASSVHGNKSQGQRERAIQAFRDGNVRVLVATDVAARGIDIPGVTHVYNYNLPEVPDIYVHRIGRTARAGADGEAIAFCAPEEKKLLRSVERLMKMGIPIASGHHVIEGTENAQQADAEDAFGDFRPEGRLEGRSERRQERSPRRKPQGKTQGKAQGKPRSKDKTRSKSQGQGQAQGKPRGKAPNRDQDRYQDSAFDTAQNRAPSRTQNRSDDRSEGEREFTRRPRKAKVAGGKPDNRPKKRTKSGKDGSGRPAGKFTGKPAGKRRGPANDNPRANGGNRPERKAS